VGCRNFVIGVGITAGAGVLCVALFGTGGGNNLGGVAVRVRFFFFAEARRYGEHHCSNDQKRKKTNSQLLCRSHSENLLFCVDWDLFSIYHFFADLSRV
jgi:hypothetical protein